MNDRRLSFDSKIPFAPTPLAMLLVVALYGCNDGGSEQQAPGVPTSVLPSIAAATPDVVRFESISSPDFVALVNDDGITALQWTASDAENYEIYRREESGGTARSTNRAAGGQLLLDDPCGVPLFDDQTGGLAASAVPAGYLYVGTVAGHAFADDTIDEPGSYTYLVIGLDGAGGPSVVAQDLTVAVARVIEPGTRAPSEPVPVTSPDPTTANAVEPATGATTRQPSAATPSVPASPFAAVPTVATPVTEVVEQAPEPVEIVEQAPEPAAAVETGEPETVEEAGFAPVVVDCTPPVATIVEEDTEESSGEDVSSGSGAGSEENSDNSVTTPDGELLAFPGALGHGRNATGGRGGRVVIVDTRKDIVDPDDGMTSLREALQEMSGPRIVTFAVGGLFETSSDIITMTGEQGSDVTVACQTAPKPGVIMRGQGIRIHKAARNIIMRHCTIRNIDPGSPDSTSGRAIGIVGTKAPVFDMIFDHMSLSWATDEGWTVWTGPTSKGNSARFTLSNSIVGEGDADSTHYESGLLPRRYMHSMGPSCNSGSTTHRIDDCSIIDNYIPHNGRRNPLMWGVTGEVIGNVVYNWYETGLDSRPHKNEHMELYIVDNIYKTGPTSKKGNWPLTIVGGAPASNHVVRNNRVIEWPSLNETKQPDKTSGKMSRTMSSSPGIDFDCVGASRPERDVVDERLIHEYETSTGQTGIFANHERNYSMYEETGARSADHDSDRDGMADTWELTNGLNPNDGSDHDGDIDGDGYTNVEEYVNDLARCG